jgi:hypothetical protein
MKRLILTMLAIGVPMAAGAQQFDTRATAEGVVIATAAATAAASETGAVQASPASSGPRRRPSMVGYVENADIGNKFRIRFDSASDLQAADRAEFFYAKCGCYRYLPANNAAYDPDAPGPGPGVLKSADYTQFNVYGEYALNGRFSLVGELPFRSLRPQEFVAGTGSFGNSSGLADLRAGVKLSMASDSNSQITFQLLFDAPTGDSMKGLGTNHWSIDPAILYSTQLGERVGIEAQFGTVFPTDGSKGVPTTSPNKFSGKVVYYGVGPSVDIYSNGTTRVAPVVELFGWHVVDGFSTAEGGAISGVDIVNLKIGGRVAFGANSIYAGWGKALTEATWYDQVFRIEYRYGF